MCSSYSITSSTLYLYFVYASPKSIVPYKPFFISKYKNDNIQGSNRIKLSRQLPHISLYATPYNPIGHIETKKKNNPKNITAHHFCPLHIV